jgi:hypothetical protein
MLLLITTLTAATSVVTVWATNLIGTSGRDTLDGTDDDNILE